MKFEMFELQSGNYLVTANLERGNEAVILPNRETAEKVKDFAENIFDGEIKELTVDGAGDEGELIVRCDSDKTFTLKLEEKEHSDVAAIVWFIKNAWTRKNVDRQE